MTQLACRRTAAALAAIGLLGLAGWAGGPPVQAQQAGAAAEPNDAVAGATMVYGTLSEGLSEGRLVDLTHPLPTFAPSDDDFAVAPSSPNSSVRNFPVPDLGRPNPDSSGFTGEPTHEYLVSNQAVLGHWFVTQPTRFEQRLTTFAFNPNLGTSIDAPAHRDVTDPAAVAAAIGFGISADEFEPDDMRHVDELGIDELFGPIVFIDISARVQAEIDRLDGDLSRVDFSNSSGNNVGLADINRVARQLTDGSWVVIRTGWDRFFHDPNAYGNGNNHPGITPQAVVRLVEIENSWGIRINGIGADNRAVDTGQSLGTAGAGGAPAHSIALSRGWKLVENLTNLGSLAEDGLAGRTMLIVAPVNLIGAAESYARVYALTMPIAAITRARQWPPRGLGSRATERAR